MLTDSEELKARIEAVKNNLRFYVLFWDEVASKGFSEQELTRHIDKQLDELIELTKQSSPCQGEAF